MLFVAMHGIRRTWHGRAADAARPRRRGDRMIGRIKLLGGAAAAWPLAVRAQEPGRTVPTVIQAEVFRVRRLINRVAANRL